ncbi:MAG: TatD family hydrolase [Clostridia bacterium]|nr:TatD family hydrolase [Clostridia bacterium]
MYSEDLKNSYPIFDTHCHYEDERFDPIRDELFREMHQNGVCGIVTCGCDQNSSKAAIKMAEDYDFVYAAVGIHPGSIDSGTTPEQIRELAQHPKCVAIGEIGLDYYWVSDNKEKQIEIFEKQIAIAKELDLPIIIHDRDAHGDTLEILKKHKPKGVVHCYSGSVEMAEELIKLGLYIGVGGVITFKNAKKLPDVVKMIPDELLLVETDCPYLAPEPYRGKLCHSGLIKYTAEKIAEIRGKTPEQILTLTAKNAKILYNVK